MSKKDICPKFGKNADLNFRSQYSGVLHLWLNGHYATGNNKYFD